jgi:hypothetical protein
MAKKTKKATAKKLKVSDLKPKKDAKGGSVMVGIKRGA